MVLSGICMDRKKDRHSGAVVSAFGWRLLGVGGVTIPGFPVFTNTSQTLPDIRSGAVLNFTRPNKILQDRKKIEQFKTISVCGWNHMGPV